MAFKDLIRNGLKSFNFGGSSYSTYSPNDPYSSYWRPLSGAQFDYRREAGQPTENSGIMSCVNWATRTFPEASMKLQNLKAGTWSAVDNHPAINLINNPNEHYDASYLWSGLVASHMVDGNGYWYVEKNGFGLPTSLYYMPHFQVAPRWDDKGTEFIHDYLYRTGDKQYSLRKQDVIHVRNGVDPQNTRKGLNPLLSVLREVCTDNEASTAAAAIMRNLGMPGLSFTPKEGIELTPDQKSMLATLSREKMTGDRRGEMLLMPVPGTMEAFGFSPEQLAFDKIRRVPEERITAVYGIPAVVVGLGAGLDRSTFANFKEAREAAYESFLLPLWRTLERQISRQYLPLWGLDTSEWRLIFDISEVKALSENTNELHERVREDFKAKIVTLEEAREKLGYQDETSTFGADVFFEQNDPKPGNDADVDLAA